MTVLAGDIIQRGQRANQLMNDALLQEGFRTLETAYVREMRKCTADDDLGRFRLVQALSDLEVIKRHLHEAISQGEITAKSTIELRKPTLVERAARIF